MPCGDRLCGSSRSGSSSTLLDGGRREAELPERYPDFLRSFGEAVQRLLHPGVSILDVGGGRTPTIPPELRPADCSYVGLDVAAEELRSAPPGSYDELLFDDITIRNPELAERFDVVVSWQVLEHVRDLPSAIRNIHDYLRPGGALVAELSGRFSVFALLNQLLPRRAGVWAMDRLLDRSPDTVFRAHYHRCWHSALRQLGRGWSQFDITPQYVAAVYFNFSPLLRNLYLSYENRLANSNYHNLATHYLIEAVR